jgi:hypothetical protein
MSERYVFVGFFAFVQFGPHGLLDIKLSCLTEDGKGVPKVGRKTCESADVEQKKVSGDVAGAPHRLDISLHQKATAAHLAQRDLMDSCQNTRELLFVETSNYQMLIEELRACEKAIKHLREIPGELFDAKDDEEMKYCKEWKQSIYDGLKAYRARKRKLDEASNQFIKLHMRKHYMHFMEALDVCESDSPTSSVVARQITEEVECTDNQSNTSPLSNTTTMENKDDTEDETASHGTYL